MMDETNASLCFLTILIAAVAATATHCQGSTVVFMKSNLRFCIFLHLILL
jgi:hypothetical protein